MVQNLCSIYVTSSGEINYHIFQTSNPFGNDRLKTVQRARTQKIKIWADSKYLPFLVTYFN